MSRSYGVKLVRGPFVKLPPHPLACEDEGQLRRVVERFGGAPLAVDMFCGAGGLSLGLDRAGYRVVAGFDNDAEALETHRSFCAGLSLDWDLSREETVERVARLVTDLEVSLVAGGPPCQAFSKAGRSMLRHLVADGRRPSHDTRRDLWEAFLEVVKRSRPPAVLMENVPDMALDRDMLILRTMVDELERAGYAVQERLVDTFRYGVPQFRQRLILVALANGIAFEWPSDTPDRVSVRQALSDLPSVSGGWRPAEGAQGWLEYTHGPRSAFQNEMRRLVPEDERGRVYDHITRPVREDDAEAFALMGPDTRYSELPDKLKRYRDDIFDDKYKRLHWDELSRTITAHIAKDGYWYIHPEQDRTLTVREAARLQTFPDHIRFAGSPTAAFRQIGNAVPPKLAQTMGTAINEAVRKRSPAGWSTRQSSRELAQWMAARHRAEQILLPWHGLALPSLLAGKTPHGSLRWPALVSQILLDRVSPAEARRTWPVVHSQLSTPEQVRATPHVLKLVAHGLRRESRVEQLLKIADAVAECPELLYSAEKLETVPAVTRPLARLAFVLVPDESHDPIEAGSAVLRVASRFWGGDPVHVENKRSHGRLAVARLVGVDDEASSDPIQRAQGRLAKLALLEIAADVCRPVGPECSRCPLQATCASVGDLAGDQSVVA